MEPVFVELLAALFTTSFLSGLVYGVPAMMFLRKAGMNQNVAFLAVMPAGAIILLWSVAFRKDDKFEVRTGS
jgi:uncharacterized membrane protein